MAVVIFILISWLVSGFPSWPPLHSTILVPAGRRERLLASMTLGVTIAGISHFMGRQCICCFDISLQVDS